MASKGGSAGDKSRYTRYKAASRVEKNQKAKVARHNKKFGTDVKGGGKHSRKAPNSRTHFYSRAWKVFANTLRKTEGSAKGLDYFLKLERAVYV